MSMLQVTKRKLLAFAGAVALSVPFAMPAQAQSKEPIKIGLGMALTGPLAANGKQALVGMKIWEEETNAKGGLLGRQVKLISYDDQSNPSTVPGIYTKLLDVDKVDIVVICSYPLSSVGITNAAIELNYKPKMLGGAMVGLQATVFKNRLGTKLNGIVNYETWVPSEKMMAPAVEFFKKYQAKAGAEGVDPLGYYLGGWGYAYIRMLGEGIAATKSVNDDKIADWLRKTEHKTIMGNWSYGPKGEWTKSGMMQVQYHDIKEGETWKGMNYQTVISPPEFATGKLIYPYEKAK
jgi:branched-chain amino acid transport system substrate-binding protein